MTETTTIQDLYNLLQDSIKKNEEAMLRQTNEVKEAISTELKKLRSDFTEEIRLLREENTELKQKNEDLEKRVTTLERRLKKYNLIIYGLEEKNENIEDVQSLLHLLNEKLEVDCKFTDLRDFFRLGKQKEESCFPRPLAIEIVNYPLKIEILKKAKELKGTGIFISQDYTPEEYNKRKILHTNKKIAQQNHHKTWIQDNILYVDNKPYSVAELEKRPLEVIRLEGGENLTGNEEYTRIDCEEKDRKKRKYQTIELENRENIIKRSHRLAARK